MIYGRTDSLKFARSGKIRAGSRDEKTGYPKNSPNFLLHDVPQLIPVLGEQPTEIFFTVLMNDIRHFFRDDLRWYTKSELVCQSMHGYINPVNSQNMGAVAAFHKVGVEVGGLKQQQFPGIARARVRQCAYKSCADYVSGNCSEHLLLDMVIPQYSMQNIFTLDSTSSIALDRIFQAFCTVFAGNFGRIAGEIFRLYKTKADVPFQNKDGSLSKRETDVVFMESYPFKRYEAEFRDKINPEDWEKLLKIRAGEFVPQIAETLINAAVLPASDERDMLPAGPSEPAAAPGTSLTTAAAQNDEEAVKSRANDPAVAKYFSEIALLVGKENSEELRIATAKAFPDVQSLADYLKGRIKDSKKAKKDAKPATQAAAPPPPPTAPAAGAGAERPLF